MAYRLDAHVRHAGMRARARARVRVRWGEAGWRARLATSWPCASWPRGTLPDALAGAPIGQKAAKVKGRDESERTALAFIRRSIGQRHAKVKRTGRIGACSALIRRLNHFLLLIPRNLVRVVSRVTRTIHWYLSCIIRANSTKTWARGIAHTRNTHPAPVSTSNKNIKTHFLHFAFLFRHSETKKVKKCNTS